jgi:hypothetical protein
MTMTTAPTSQTMLFIPKLHFVSLHQRQGTQKVPSAVAGTFGATTGSDEAAGLCCNRTQEECR